MSSRLNSATGAGGRSARVLLAATVVSTVMAFGLAGSAAAATPQVNIVSKTHSGTFAGGAYFNTIQGAVTASKPGGYVLIEAGVYDESVKVSSAQTGIYIRGMNRNKVIVDGQHKVGNGIEIDKANNVWVENLTVRNFEFCVQEEGGPECGDEEDGNDIWWNGGAESGKIGAHGWYGSYLTAYTSREAGNEAVGKRGGYGIFTGNETEGSWENIYASGFADSGIYIGACQECKAKVKNATMEDNALGYSGSNAGGSLIIEKSTFAHNTVGIAPNSENPGDPPPPQDGECNRPNIEHPNPTPTITSTNVSHCTIFRQDKIVENNNLKVPPNGSTEVAPWGVGVELPGDYADQVENDTISGNPNAGVLGFEYPNPFPFNPEEPPEGTIDFQLAGNRINNNTFSANGNNVKQKGSQFQGDVALLSGGGEFLDDNFGYEFAPAQSVDNCAINNHFADATYPAKIEKTWGCQNKTTPNPGGGEAGVFYLLGLLEEAGRERAEHPPVAQAPPPEQPTMPNPCNGVPKNPLCK